MNDAARSHIAAEIPLAAETDANESVGAVLRKAREQRGLTLSQVSRDLCLKEDVLRALESRQYSALPKVPYCFAFLRTYARHLGLEPEEMVRRFKGEIGEIPPAVRLAVPQPLRSSRLPGRALAALSLAAAAAAYGAWYFYAQPAEIYVPATTADAHAPMAPVPLIDPETARKLNAASAAAAERPPENAEVARIGSTTTSATPPIEPAKSKIVIRATGPCWVYIHNARGKVVFHKIMRRGEEFVIPEPHADLVMDLGNPVALRIVVGGRTLKPFSGPGQPRRVSLNPKHLSKLP